MDQQRRSLNPMRASALRLSMILPNTPRPKQVREAKEMERVVKEKAARFGLRVPAYTFVELIGRGSFGRVFKCRRLGGSTSKDTAAVVAIKVIDVDQSDYRTHFANKDQAMQDILNEISVLQRLKATNARNVNLIHEAFNFHSQLWIVSDFCPGGSIHTLMKACATPGLEEKYIIPIARELAIALEHVHTVGVVHRDLKAANVLITQDGHLQLCDFGVSGILESDSGKRSTIVGTQHWMPPEMHVADQDASTDGYGSEVDIWAYGCTIYELAEGRPPNATIVPARLPLFLTAPPKLEDERHSPGLKAFVAFCLELVPANRPSIQKILAHPYIADSEAQFPTTNLRHLIEQFAIWERRGGERASLFNGHGAHGTAIGPSPGAPVDDDYWNFSEGEEEAILNEGQVDIEANPVRKSVLNRSATTGAMWDKRAARGESKLGRIFNLNGKEYEYADYSEPEADLPLRNIYGQAHAEVRESVIDLDAVGYDMDNNVSLTNVPLGRKDRSPFFQFPDEDEEDDEFEPDNTAEDSYLSSQQGLTKRATKDWKFPVRTTPANVPRPPTQEWSMARAIQDMRDGSGAAPTHLAVPGGDHAGAPARPQLKHTVTAPTGSLNDPAQLHATDNLSLDLNAPDRSSMIDLDMGDGDLSYVSTSTDFGMSADSSFSDLSMAESPGERGEFDLADVTEWTPQHAHSQSEPKLGRASQLADSPPREDDLHQVSLQVPTGGQRTTKSFDDTYPSAGAGMTMSAAEAAHGRMQSVKASMDSLRRFTDEEDGESSPSKRERERERASARRSRSLVNAWSLREAQAEQQAQQLTARQRHFAPQLTAKLSKDSQVQFQPVESSLREYAMRRRHSRGRAPGSDELAAKLGHPAHNAFGTSNGGSLGYGRGRGMSAPGIKPFPAVIPVLPAALEEDASIETVVSEMQRLLDDYLHGLKLVGELFQGDDARGGGVVGAEPPLSMPMPMTMPAINPTSAPQQQQQQQQQYPPRQQSQQQPQPQAQQPQPQHIQQDDSFMAEHAAAMKISS